MRYENRDIRSSYLKMVAPEKPLNLLMLNVHPLYDPDRILPIQKSQPPILLGPIGGTADLDQIPQRNGKPDAAKRKNGIDLRPPTLLGNRTVFQI
jgi:hypothetical protein